MTFCQEPFPDGLPSYVKHTDVKEYLWSIAEKHQLNKYIEVSMTWKRMCMFLKLVHECHFDWLFLRCVQRIIDLN